MNSNPISSFAGINNRQPIDRIRPTDRDAAVPVRDALNVDLSTSGTFQRRPGTEKIISGTNIRSLHETSSGALFADGDELFSFDGETATSVASLLSSYATVAYAETPLGTVWSDGYRLNVIQGGSSKSLAPAKPNPEPAAWATTGGGLIAGTYGVFFTTIRSDGQQSAPTIPTYLDVPEGGQINVSNQAMTDGIAVYVTATDGAMFYQETVISAGQTSASIPLVASSGQSMSFEVVDDVPAGSILALHKGRLLSALGSYLLYSLPWNMGLYRPASDYIPFASDITLIASVEGGVYVATANETFWFAGGDISAANMVSIMPYGAVRGTLTTVPDSTSVAWFSPRGPVIATAFGEASAVQNKQIAFPSANSGASIWRESNGLRQFISAISTTPELPSGAAVAGSYMDAEVIKP